MTLTTTIMASIVGQYSKTMDLSSPQSTPSLILPVSLANGITDAQADLIWGDTRTIAASGTDDLDLRGVLTDDFGAVLNIVELVALLVFASAANVNNVILGNAAANGFIGPFGAATHTIAIKPGGFKMWYDPAGWAVTAGTGDLLRVANGGAGTSVDYSILIVGRSA